MRRRRKKKKTSFLGVFLFILLIALYYSNYSNAIKQENNIDGNDLNIYYLDVGQADSILISNQEHNMLIDAGNNEDGDKLVKYFKELGIDKFDYVVGTHPHEDHIGGLDDIVNNFEVMNIYLPDAYTTTKTYEDLLDSIEKKNLKISIPKIGENFNLGNVKFKVIYTGDDLKDLNNTSIVLRGDFYNTSYLFTGDATSKTEKEIINSDIDVDVLKVGHHGSQYSSTSSFLQKVSPKYAIISVGNNNSYNHPSEATIKKIEKYTSEIYETSKLGTIHLISDGTNINFEYLKTDTNG